MSTLTPFEVVEKAVGVKATEKIATLIAARLPKRPYTINAIESAINYLSANPNYSICLVCHLPIENASLPTHLHVHCRTTLQGLGAAHHPLKLVDPKEVQKINALLTQNPDYHVETDGFNAATFSAPTEKKASKHLIKRWSR